MKKILKKIPKFKSEDEERKFWEEADSTDYIDWADSQVLTLPKLNKNNPVDFLKKIVWEIFEIPCSCVFIKRGRW